MDNRSLAPVAPRFHALAAEDPSGVSPKPGAAAGEPVASDLLAALLEADPTLARLFGVGGVLKKSCYRTMRNSVRAIITRGSEILLIHRVKADGAYWMLPGGGVEPGEPDHAAVIRECREELGLRVQPMGLVDEVLQPEQGHHRLYACYITGGTLGTGDGPEYAPDGGYAGTHQPAWVPLQAVASLNFQPREIQQFLLHHW